VTPDGLEPARRGAEDALLGVLRKRLPGLRLHLARGEDIDDRGQLVFALEPPVATIEVPVRPRGGRFRRARQPEPEALRLFEFP
jgi:hypothetical protein